MISKQECNENQGNCKQLKPIPEDELWEIFKKHSGNGLNYARAIEEYHGIK